MLVINTSVSSLNAQRKLSHSSKDLSVSFERLSSGLRINGAKDDAAGLSISTRMTAQAKGLQKSIQNSTDWISLFQTADGALNEMTNILQRIRELSVQSANGTNNDLDRASLSAEVTQLTEELDRIATTTQFNGIDLLNGDVQNSYIQFGANTGEDEAFTIQKLNGNNLGRGVHGGPNAPVDTTVATNNLVLHAKGQSFEIRDTVPADDTFSTSNAANSAIAKANAVNSQSDAHGVTFRVKGTTFTSTAAVGATSLDEDTFLTINNVKIAGFDIQNNDADGALSDAINAAYDQTGVSASVNAQGQLVLFAQDGRNIEFEVTGIGAAFAGQADNTATVTGGVIEAVSRETFSFDNNIVGAVSNDVAFGGNDILNATVGVYASEQTAVATYDISTRENAVRVLDVIEFALADVLETRAEVGAQQNRLESTVANLQVAHENLSASRSRILDADFAAESAQLAQSQIIQQAGVSVLSQANQNLSLALSLLS